MNAPRADGYAPASRWLHWLTALLVVATIPVALTMTRIDDGMPKNTLYELHKSFGILIFLLAAARVLARLVLGAPSPYPELNPAQRIVSTATHHLLYLLLFAMPVFGFIGTSMCCAPVNLFWTVPVPFAFSGSEHTIELILAIHTWAGYLMTLLVGLHVAGALYHYLIRNDGVMARMSLFGR